MKILGLDLSLNNTGWAVYDGNTVKYGSVLVKKDLCDFEKCLFLLKHINALVKEHEIEDLVIEDTYFGLNYAGFKSLTRLGGIVQYYWHLKKKKQLKLLLAVQARKLMGISGKATKAEIQVFIAEKLNIISGQSVVKYRNRIEELKAEKASGSLSKGRTDYILVKISNEIAEETDLNNDQADAILLSMAYYRLLTNPESQYNKKK